MLNVGTVIALIKSMQPEIDPTVIESAVSDWLDAHPEATTTVQDGSITEAKLASALAAKIGQIASLSDEIADLEQQTTMSVPRAKTWNNMYASGNTGYISTNGNITEYTNEYVSEYVPIDNEKTINYKLAYIYGVSIAGAFYDSNKAFISGSGIVAGSGSSGTFAVATGTVTPPANAKYFRYSMSKNSVGGITQKEQFCEYYELTSLKSVVENVSVNGENPWNGKKWCAFGTSITDSTYYNTETGENTGKYVPFLAEMSGMEVTNRGIAGGTLASGGIHGGSHNILDAILNSNDLDDFDLITIEGFVNDFACAITIGDIGDTAYTTFYGALYQAISYCLEHSHAEIVLVTETTGKLFTIPSTGNEANYTILRKNSLDLYQQAYNDAMIRMGQYYGVHVIDAGGKSQINQYHPEYIIDQIHHTTLGGEQYAKTIWEELKNITPAKVASV